MKIKERIKKVARKDVIAGAAVASAAGVAIYFAGASSRNKEIEDLEKEKNMYEDSYCRALLREFTAKVAVRSLAFDDEEYCSRIIGAEDKTNSFSDLKNKEFENGFRIKDLESDFENYVDEAASMDAEAANILNQKESIEEESIEEESIEELGDEKETVV